jgi:V/A-type H+-transporting ATPase subunit D
MAKIKHTKTELKAQSDALKRFQRFLPMLQLKKQQLQAEIAVIVTRIEAVAARESAAHASLAGWVKLFSETGVQLENLVRVDRVVTETSTIAGVTIPVFKAIETTINEIDLFATPAWFDQAVTMLTTILGLKAERVVLDKQRGLVTTELNTTSQRVNLFDKVKIPECRENIRTIKIAIGDAQIASVTRGKIAKSRSRQSKEEDAA